MPTHSMPETGVSTVVFEAHGGDCDKLDDRIAGCIVFAEQHSDVEVLSFISSDDAASDDAAPDNMKIIRADNPARTAVEQFAELEDCALVTMGDTGGMVKAAIRKPGRYHNAIHPPLCCVMPNLDFAREGQLVFADVGGANLPIDNHPYMAFVGLATHVVAKYTARLAGTNGNFALDNVGHEDGKGGDTMKRCGDMLRALFGPLYVGFCEPHMAILPMPSVDGLITCGTTGNIALKTAEMAYLIIAARIKAFCKQQVEDPLDKALIGQLMQSSLDVSQYNGAYFIGVRKPMFIGHGGAKLSAVTAALKRAADPSTKQIWWAFENDELVVETMAKIRELPRPLKAAQ